MVTISKKRFIDLINTERKLRALSAGGVDNWDWYSDSLEEWEELEYDADISEIY